MVVLLQYIVETRRILVVINCYRPKA